MKIRSDLHSNAGSPPALNLMFMSEQRNASPPSSIVERTCRTVRAKGGESRTEKHTTGENAKCCGLSTVYISDDRTTHLRDIRDAEGW